MDATQHTSQVMQTTKSRDKVLTTESLVLPLPRKGTTTDTLLQRITLDVNTNDISQTNYTQGGTNNHALEAVSPIFCDNVILYYHLPMPTEDSNIANYVKQHLPEHTYRIKRILNEIGVNVNKSAIKPTQHKALPKCIRQYVKVALQDTPIENVMQICTCMQTLTNNGIYVNDMDFTQDYRGVIDKTQVIEYLVNQHEYRIDADSDEDDYHILSNDEVVSLNCLSIIHSTEQCRIRYKIYNKFVQMCESPSVRNAVGNHFAHWIHCPERILRENISKTTDTGLLRIELTFYVENKPISMDFVQQHISYLANLLPPNLVYHNPIQTQWNLLLSNIHYNTLVIDKDAKRCLFSYYVNRLTRKITGFYTDIGNKDLVLKLYSFNLPIRVVEYTTTDNMSTDTNPPHGLRLEQHWYEKVLVPSTDKRHKLDQLITYLTKGCKEFQSKYTIHHDGDANAVGFVDNAICRFRVAKKTTIIRIPIELRQIQAILSLAKLGMTNTCREVEFEKEFLLHYQDTIDEIRKCNANIEEQHKQQLAKQRNLEEQIQQIKQQQQAITNHLITTLSNKAKRLLELPDKTRYYLYAYRDASRKQKRWIIALSTEPTISDTTPLEVYVATKEVRMQLDACNFEDELYELGCNVYGRNSGQPIFAIQRNGHMYSKSNNKQPVIEILSETHGDGNSEEEDRQAIVELEDQIEDIDNEMQTLKHNHISSKCPKIDDVVQKGDVVSIIDTFPYRNSYLLRCKVNGNEITCKSNKWMDNMLEGKQHAFSVIASIPKRHPIAKRTIVSFIE